MTFSEWYTRRYGPPPSNDSLDSLLKAVYDAEARLAVANMKYEKMKLYTEWISVAEESWNEARDQD